MSKEKEDKIRGDGLAEKHKKDKKEKKHKKERKAKARAVEKATEKASFSLLADETIADPTLSSLFAAKPTPPQRNATNPKSEKRSAASHEDVNEDGVLSDASDNDELIYTPAESSDDEALPEADLSPQRRKKRKHEGDEVEDVYMRRLAREEAKDAEIASAERVVKRRKADGDSKVLSHSEEDGMEDKRGASANDDDTSDSGGDPAKNNDDTGAISPPPKHETQDGPSVELSKANRTTFLGNVSTTAISSNSSRRELIKHLCSFFPSLSSPKDGQPKHAVESLRFRSTPYAAAIPKKAAFATKQLMPATTASTNAYVVYSSELLARHSMKNLNGTVVLGRHLRVDSVAHPAKVDHRRCVFVGNLGFVDDESNIQAANAEAGHEHRKPSKTPADVEEGLWRTFGKCGVVESVRVIRDSTTRVGKGIAYVQFDDENAVEAALGLNEKKFPPMLPRKLRVARAKAQKRNAKPGSDRPSSRPRPNNGTGYQKKITGEEASKLGRTRKLFGRAAAAVAEKGGQQKTGANQLELGQRSTKATGVGGARLAEGITRPEHFVFEGHRATSGSGKAGLKLGGRKKKGGKATGRSAAFKSKAKAKSK